MEGLVLVVDGLHFDELEDGPADLDEVLFVLVSELHLLDFLGNQFGSGAFKYLDQGTQFFLVDVERTLNRFFLNFYGQGVQQVEVQENATVDVNPIVFVVAFY